MSSEIQPLRIRVPVDARFAQTLRLAASSIATTANFTLEEIEDLKIAVEEAYLMSVEVPDGPSELDFSFRIYDDRLEVRVGTLPPPAEDGSNEQGAYGLMILRAVVDEATFVVSESGSELVMVKIKQGES